MKKHSGHDSNSHRNPVVRLCYDDEQWKSRLLGKRTVTSYRRRVGEKLFSLKLTSVFEPIWPKPALLEEMSDNPLLDDLLDNDWVAPSVEPKTMPSRGAVRIRMEAERLDATGWAIDIAELLMSCIKNGYYNIFTCDCGSPECAGIRRGVAVIHEGDLTVWRVHDLRPRRILVFNRHQYCDEILKKISEVLKLYQAAPANTMFGDIETYEGPEAERQRVKRALVTVENSRAENEPQKNAAI